MILAVSLAGAVAAWVLLAWAFSRSSNVVVVPRMVTRTFTVTIRANVEPFLRAMREMGLTMKQAEARLRAVLDRSRCSCGDPGDCNDSWKAHC